MSLQFLCGLPYFPGFIYLLNIIFLFVYLIMAAFGLVVAPLPKWSRDVGGR